MSKTEADYLAELISFKSVSVNTAESLKCAEFCSEFFKNAGLYTEIITSKGYPNVVATTRQTKKPKILLQAHMDVVPAEDELFEMKQIDGKCLGRGSFDMKFAGASYMTLLDKLGKEASNYDFGIMLSFDEEIGGHNGVEALLEQGYGAEVCVLPDSGTNWRLETSANGAWWVKLSKSGKNAHASTPDEGVNAAEILTKAIEDVYKLRQNYSKDELALSLTKMKAGTAINQIPDFAEMILDIRYKTTDVFDRLKAQLDQIATNHSIDIETVEFTKCANVNPDHPYLKDFVQVAEKILNRQIEHSHSTGATDARYFCTKNIPCIVIQPNGGGMHSDNEWVDAAGVRDLTNILYEFITKCAVINTDDKKSQ